MHPAQQFCFCFAPRSTATRFGHCTCQYSCSSYKTAKKIPHRSVLCVTSGYRRDADEVRALLGYYAAYSGSSVPTFRDNLSVPSSRLMNPSKAGSTPNRQKENRNKRETAVHIHPTKRIHCLDVHIQRTAAVK
jgi:hypothetical protein